MEIQANIPKLRFPEFSGDWNSTELGDVFSIFNGYAFSSSDSVTNGTLWVKIADVGIQEMKVDSLSYLPENYKTKHQKFLLKKGDYVIALTRPILNGKLKIAQINDFFNDSLLNQRVGKIESDNYHSFVYSLLQKENLINDIENSIAGTDPPNLSPSQINSITVSTPTLPEQTKIANFLTAVDEKLTQLKKKKSLLEQYKKGVMQKLFSQELRFKDENGEDFAEWEDRKLGDLFVFNTTNSFSRDNLNYEAGSVKNIHYGDIHTKFQSHFDVKKELVPFINDEISLQRFTANNYCQEGDLIVADASEDYADIGKAIEIVNLNNEKVIAGLHTLHARPNLDKLAIGFSGHLMKSENVRLQIKTQAQGTKVLSITTGRLAQINIKLPCITEQTKIANFLSAIDDKINHCVVQIEKMEVWKKGLLQQMFV